MLGIIIINKTISKEYLQEIAKQRFGDMVKGVIDISTKELALGGELHADQEALLIEKGNEQDNLWGINIYVEEPFPENIEFDSIINIRPSQNNRSRNVDDPEIQKIILAILQELLE
ncbi:DUF5674 family protein [Candidatus Margulisiibacteriota bacterium]